MRGWRIAAWGAVGFWVCLSMISVVGIVTLPIVALGAALLARDAPSAPRWLPAAVGSGFALAVAAEVVIFVIWSGSTAAARALVVEAAAAAVLAGLPSMGAPARRRFAAGAAVTVALVWAWRSGAPVEAALVLVAALTAAGLWGRPHHRVEALGAVAGAGVFLATVGASPLGLALVVIAAVGIALPSAAARTVRAAGSR